MSSISSLSDRLRAASAALEIPGVVAVADGAQGTFAYAEAFGLSSLEPDVAPKPLALDSTFYLASSTKVMTSIVALQCVQCGQFTLDEDVTRFIPELKDIDVLEGFDEDGRAVLCKAKNKITLRHLLTHTSGLAYEQVNPLIQRWRHSLGGEIPHGNRAIADAYLVPLLFEPGTNFNYSTGIDFAGLMVMRANSTTLGAYMEQYIWQPLGITNATFQLKLRPDMRTRKAQMSERTGGAHPAFMVALDPSAPLVFAPYDEPHLNLTDDSGGSGAYASISDFAKVLKSLAAGDGKLLGSEMMQELFRPQLPVTAKNSLKSLLEIKEMNNIMGGIGVGVDVDHGLGDIGVGWAGLPNVYWWVDPVADVSGVFGTQILPTGDAKVIELFRVFEAAVYAHIAEKDSKSGS